MSEKQWTIAGVVAAVVFGPPSWWVMFIEHPETAGMMVTALRVISPVVMFAIGAFTGYKYCSWKSSERRATELAAKDAEIAKAVDAATKPLQEQIDRMLNRENFALMRLRGLSLKELGIVKQFMTQSGEVHLKVDDASVRKLADSGMIRINTDTYCPPDLFPFTLDDSLRSLLTEFPDTLDRAVAEAESVKSRYGDD